MRYFNFNNLITKYSRDFTIIKQTGNYNDSGDYIKEPSKYNLNGAIISLTENKIYRSEGTLTAQDKVLYMLTPIDDALMSGIVVFKGNSYRIEAQSGNDNDEFTGVYTYTLKFVSAFNDGGESNGIS